MSEQAGREMDARVAVEVMGWHESEYWAGGERVVGLFHSSWGFADCAEFGPPHFSTDHEDAIGGVVREMARRGYDFEGGVVGHTGAYARFRHYERPTDEVPDGAASVDPRQVAEKSDATNALPLAICLAALRALTPPPATDEVEPTPSTPSDPATRPGGTPE